jgi:hypothetical protein
VADFCYLDDSANEAGPERALAHSYVKGVLLSNLGYFVHVVKSHIQPAPCQVWLGFEVDLAQRVFRVPPEKLARFLSLLDSILAAPSVDPATLRSFAGKCVSLTPAVPGAMLFTRAMFDSLAAADRASAGGSRWRARRSGAARGGEGGAAPAVLGAAGQPAGGAGIRVSGLLREELTLWTQLRGWHGTRPWRSERHFHVRVGTDASVARWGGWVQMRGAPADLAAAGLPLAPVLAGDVWADDEAWLDIAAKEMLAVPYTLRAALPPAVRDALVELTVDNMAVHGLLQSWRAARGRGLLLAQRALFSLMMELNLAVDSSWISTHANKVADAVSRLPLAGEGRLRRDLFLLLQRAFGAFTLDAMAGAGNAQCPRYVSYLHTPGALAADVFAYRGLAAEPLVYVFPPAAVVGPVLSYMREERARGVLVAREDEGAPWWPLVATLRGRVCLAAAGDASAVEYPAGTAASRVSAQRGVGQRLLAFRFDFRV